MWNRITTAEEDYAVRNKLADTIATMPGRPNQTYNDRLAMIDNSKVKGRGYVPFANGLASRRIESEIGNIDVNADAGLSLYGLQNQINRVKDRRIQDSLDAKISARYSSPSGKTNASLGLAGIKFNNAGVMDGSVGHRFDNGLDVGAKGRYDIDSGNLINRGINAGYPIGKSGYVSATVNDDLVRNQLDSSVSARYGITDNLEVRAGLNRNGDNNSYRAGLSYKW